MTQHEKENKVLRSIIYDLHWMARRYANGRRSYATGLFNDHVRALLALGVELNKADGTPWARDMMGRDFDGLTDEEARVSTGCAREIGRVREGETGAEDRPRRGPDGVVRGGGAEMSGCTICGGSGWMETGPCSCWSGTKPASPADSTGVYLGVVDRLEPDVTSVDRDAALASIAISLRRIADALEKGARHGQGSLKSQIEAPAAAHDFGDEMVKRAAEAMYQSEAWSTFWSQEDATKLCRAALKAALGEKP